MNISRRASNIVESPIRRIVSLIAAAKNESKIISFGGGAPSLSPPSEVIDALCKSLSDNPRRATAYGATRGDTETIDCIIEDLKDYNVYVNTEEVIVTAGATEGIWLAIMSTISRGDEVITLDPTYVGYETPTNLVDGRLIRIPTQWEHDFQPDLDKIKNAITNHTSAIILLSPDNPTGRVLNDGILKGIIDIASDYDLWLIFDETYKDIFYEGKYKPIVNMGDTRERTICVFTLSKSASIPGLRIGYAYGTQKVIKAMERVKQFMTLCPSTLAQSAMRAFYSGNVKRNYIDNVVLPTYHKRLEVMGKCLRKELPEAGFSQPKGAFYYFVDVSKYLTNLGINDETFSTNLFNQERVVVIPGEYFGTTGRGHLRFTFVSEPGDRIETGIKRVRSYLTCAGPFEEAKEIGEYLH